MEKNSSWKQKAKRIIVVCIFTAFTSVYLIASNKIRANFTGFDGEVSGQFYPPKGYFAVMYDRPYPMLLLIAVFITSILILLYGLYKLRQISKNANSQ